MDTELITPDIQLKHADDVLDAEFDQHNVDVEEILARTQRSFSARRRHVQLYEAPEFVKRLNAFEEVTAGDTVIFECQWRAFPKPTIKWYKDDEEITEDPRYDTEMDVDNTGIVKLVINSSQKADEGAYKCKAENQEGVASTTGYLSVTGGASNQDKTLAAKQKKERKEKRQLEKKQQQLLQQQQEKQQQQQLQQQDNNDDPTLRKVQSDSKVSYPPHLRTIIEQKSLEEREAESLQNQPPSPIQEFIEKMQTGRGRGATWPYAVLGYKRQDDDDDAQSNSSDTSVESQVEYDFVANGADDDDVFTSSDPDEKQSNVQNDETALQNQHENTTKAANNNISKDSSHSNSSVRPVVCRNIAKVPEITITETQKYKTGSSPKRKGTEHQKPPRVVPKGSPLDLSRALEILDSPWIYFLPFTSSMTFVASATEMNPLFLVLIMVVVSLVAFHFLFPDEESNT